MLFIVCDRVGVKKFLFALGAMKTVSLYWFDRIYLCLVSLMMELFWVTMDQKVSIKSMKNVARKKKLKGTFICYEKLYLFVAPR